MIDVDLILGLADTILLQYSFIYHEMLINSITLSDAMLHHGTWSILVQLMATKCRYNVVQHNMIFHMVCQRLRWNMHQRLYSQKTPHISPSRASYGMSFMRKIDRIIMALHSIYKCNPLCQPQGPLSFCPGIHFIHQWSGFQSRIFCGTPNGSLWPHKLGVRNFYII